jgi:hypothetical protein
MAANYSIMTARVKSRLQVTEMRFLIPTSGVTKKNWEMKRLDWIWYTCYTPSVKLPTSWTGLYSCLFHELGDSLFIFCPLHELASTHAHFTNWAILCSFFAHFMNWPLLLPISRTGRFFVHFLPTSWTGQICMLHLRLGCSPLSIVVPSSLTGHKMYKESPSSWNGQG